MIIPPVKKSKIDNTIKTIMKYLRESNNFTPEQRQLFTDFIDILNTYKSQEYPSNSSEEQSNDINHKKKGDEYKLTTESNQTKIDNTIEITKKYLRESEHFTQSQRQLFNDFIHNLEIYKSQQHPSNDNKYHHYDNKFNFPEEDGIDSESNYITSITGGVYTI